jgi:hypothetical protein
MSSRKHKKKRKPGLGNFEKARTFDDAGVHLPSFIAGMVISVLAILLIWNYFTTPDSATKALAAADAGQLSTSTELMQEDKFESILESADVDQLCTILVELALKNKKDRLPVEIESDSRRLVDVANKLISFSLTEKQRVLAIKSKIDALSVIYGLDFQYKLSGPNVSEELRSVSETYSKDANQEIARSARVALLKHNAFERLKRPTRPNLELLADQIIELLTVYPDDEMTLTTLSLIIRYYVSDNLEDATFLIQEIQSAVPGIESTKLSAIMRDVSDHAKIRSLGYDVDFDNRWLNGVIGEKELIKQSIDLLGDSHYGPVILQTVDRVTQWFEQEGKYDQAVEVYRQMLESSESNESPEVARLALKTAVCGLTRAKLVNQKMNFSGVSHDGSPLDPTVFERRVVIVLFWSPKNKDSMDGLDRAYKQLISYRSQGLRILAVCKEQTLSKQSKTYIATMPSVVFVVGDPDKNGENLIWSQCPSTSLPRAMLVDRTGVVADINVPIPDLETDAGFLLSRLSDL